MGKIAMIAPIMGGVVPLGSSGNEAASSKFGRMLLIGEGDFSFARSLVEGGHVKPSDLVATEVQPRSALTDAAENIEWLEQRGVKIEFEVDARKLGERSDLGEFDTIRWNFPRDDGSPVGAGGRMGAIFTEFFAGAKSRLKPSGTIELALDYIQPYRNYGYIPAAAASGWNYLGHTPFDFSQYPRYRHRFTTGRGSREMVNPVVHRWSH